MVAIRDRKAKTIGTARSPNVVVLETVTSPVTTALFVLISIVAVLAVVEPVIDAVVAVVVAVVLVVGVVGVVSVKSTHNHTHTLSFSTSENHSEQLQKLLSLNPYAKFFHSNNRCKGKGGCI